MTDDLTGKEFTTAPYVTTVKGRECHFQEMHHLMLFEARIQFATADGFLKWWSSLHPGWVKQITPLLTEEEQTLVAYGPRTITALKEAAEADLFNAVKATVEKLGYSLIRKTKD